MSRTLQKSNIAVDFSTLRGAFIRDTILPHDIDGVVEIGGKFLFIECKQKGENISIGQRKSLEQLSKQNIIKVIIVELDGTKGPQGAHLFIPERFSEIKDGRQGPWQYTSIDDFKNRCGLWSGKKVKPQEEDWIEAL